MSGLKYSSIQLEQEKKACQEALSKINVFLGSIESLREKVKTMLDEIPDGVKGTFPEEVKKIKSFQAKDIPIPSERQNSTELNRIAEHLQKINDEGIAVVYQLIEIREVRREAKGRELMGKLETLKSDLSGMNTLLDRWKSGVSKNILKRLDGLYPMLERGDFVEVEREINHSWNTLVQLRQEVTTLETQDEQRRYVLEALRKVCREMGWGEEKKPVLENESDPGSPILYEVETYYAGKIEFRLTLEGIKVDSPISAEKGACYREFDNLSERLRTFGVITKFRPPESLDEDPKLIQKGELDLPDEGMTMEIKA